MFNCSICWSEAHQSFYGAIACDACRTFFRRRVLSKKVRNLVMFFSFTNLFLKTRKVNAVTVVTAQLLFVMESKYVVDVVIKDASQWE